MIMDVYKPDFEHAYWRITQAWSTLYGDVAHHSPEKAHFACTDRNKKLKTKHVYSSALST